MSMHHTEYDELADKVGGRFKLTVLIQKRMRELNRGARPLIKIDSSDHMDIVVAEIREGLIELAPGEDVIHNLKVKAAKAAETEE